MKTQKGADRVLKSITNFVEKKLKLKVNREKTVVAQEFRIKYLGFGFYFKDGKALVRIHKKSKERIKQKIRIVLKKTAGYLSDVELTITLRRIIMGWINYYKIANMRDFLRNLDAWMRSKIRCRIWKHWKKVRTRYRNLRALGLSHEEAIKFANTRKGYWRVAHSHILCCTLTNEYLNKLGYIYFTDYYDKVTGR